MTHYDTKCACGEPAAIYTQGIPKCWRCYPVEPPSGRIPAWVRWVYHHAHFCPEMDDWLAGCFRDRQPKERP